MGCGKTFFAKELSEKFNYNFIDIDDIVEFELKATIAETFATKGEDYFRQMEHKVLLQQIAAANKPTIIATGGGTPCYYNAIDVMNKIGVTIWLNQSIEKITDNINNKKKHRPLLNNIDDDKLHEHLKSLLQQRFDCYSKSQHKLVDEQISIENLQKIILQYA